MQMHNNKHKNTQVMVPLGCHLLCFGQNKYFSLQCAIEATSKQLAVAQGRSRWHRRKHSQCITEHGLLSSCCALNLQGVVVLFVIRERQQQVLVRTSSKPPVLDSSYTHSHKSKRVSTTSSNKWRGQTSICACASIADACAPLQGEQRIRTCFRSAATSCPRIPLYLR